MLSAAMKAPRPMSVPKLRDHPVARDEADERTAQSEDGRRGKDRDRAARDRFGDGLALRFFSAFVEVRACEDDRVIDRGSQHDRADDEVSDVLDRLAREIRNGQIDPDRALDREQPR